MTDRRKDDRRKDAETAKLFDGTAFDRRDHDDAECQAEPGHSCCERCGRPISDLERSTYRAL